MRSHGAALLACALSLCLPVAASGTARGAERKKVAVLEYRAGVSVYRQMADRLATALRKNAALVVVDPAEARRRLPRVDAEAGRCAGDATCLSQLGAQLGVEEVLLVGISQLGDVVLALQRIDVLRGKVGPQLSETLEGDEPDDARLLGWLKQLYPPEVFKRYGFISVITSVDGAAVKINTQVRGDTPLGAPLKVIAPRSYRVDLEKSGYLPFSASIDVLPDATVEVRAELSPEAAPLPWYKRWYVWAIVGGVVAAGAIGTAVYLARPDDMHVSGFIMR
jgi:hypothetical protein